MYIEDELAVEEGVEFLQEYVQNPTEANLYKLAASGGKQTSPASTDNKMLELRKKTRVGTNSEREPVSDRLKREASE